VFSPFLVANSGPPFNITTGRDTNLDRQFNERPSFAAAGADCNAANIRCTPFGNFNMSPLPGETIVPRNYGHAPGSVTVNVRVSRTFGFGGEANKSAAAAKQGNQKTADNYKTPGAGGAGRGGPMAGAGGAGRGPGGPGGPGGGGGPQMMMMGGGPGGGAPGAQKYQLQVSVNFQNLLNHVNLGTPVGNLSSPFFGQSVNTGGNFGFFGPGGGGGGTGAGNRRVTLSARFSF
jgi:hypothetical protein